MIEPREGRYIDFVVRGKPAPQGSKKSFVVNGRAIMKDDNEKELKAWRKKVALEAELHRATWIRQSPLEVRLLFVSQPPPKRLLGGEWCAVMPDIDKLARAMLDGLVDGKALIDDAQVVRLVCEKRYGTDLGVRVTITDVGHMYPAETHQLEAEGAHP